MANTKKAGAAKKVAKGKPDIASLLATAKLPEKTVALYLRGDLVAEVENLERQILETRGADGRLTSGATARKLAQQVEALREQMANARIVFRLRALPRRRFLQFQAEHAPRPGNEDDTALGFNSETFGPDLVKLCTVEPELTDEQWDVLIDTISTPQWLELSNAAVTLQSETVSVPFSLAASRILRSSDET